MNDALFSEELRQDNIHIFSTIVEPKHFDGCLELSGDHSMHGRSNIPMSCGDHSMHGMMRYHWICEPHHASNLTDFWRKDRLLISTVVNLEDH